MDIEKNITYYIRFFLGDDIISTIIKFKCDPFRIMIVAAALHAAETRS